MTLTVSRVRRVRPVGGPGAWAERLGAKHPYSVQRSEELTRVTFGLHSACTTPVLLRAWQGDVRDGAFCTEVTVRCRQCAVCLRMRRRQWVARALGEFACHPGKRTWFVTLTCNPDTRYRHQALARERYGFGFGSLTPERQLGLSLLELGRTVTLYLKRLRKALPRSARIRYLMAFEQHPSSGEWHVHMLVHEVNGSIGERVFREEWGNAPWHLGFAEATLVKNASSAAFYVASYLESHPGTRMRASLHYGHGGLRKQPEGANAALAHSCSQEQRE